MSSLPIVIHPNPLLRKKSKSAKKVTRELRHLATDMLDTMYQASGIGLAAVQVGELVRLFVCDISGDRSDPHILINPKIIRKEGRCVGIEGCLSIPGVQGYVKRWQSVSVYALRLNGQSQRIDAADLLARVIQHELDHLDGVLIIDKLEEPPLSEADGQTRL